MLIKLRMEKKDCLSAGNSSKTFSNASWRRIMKYISGAHLISSLRSA
jgi:hypothetical protein